MYVLSNKYCDAYRFGFNGMEKDDEWDNVTGSKLDFGARIYDARIGRWLACDPLARKYPAISSYVFVGNMPLIAIDEDGKDIIFIIDKEKAEDNGHIAVLIGNETDGWNYVSLNGTGETPKAYGEIKNSDDKKITTTDGAVITDPIQAILRANVINPNEKHTYDAGKRIKTTKKEDAGAIIKAVEIASKEIYGIAGPGVSCIDVALKAYESIVEGRDLDESWYEIFDDNVEGEDDLIPNNWYDKLEERVNDANKNSTKEKKNSIEYKGEYKIQYKKKKDTQSED